MTGPVVLVVLGVGALLGLVVLTATGQRRRGTTLLPAIAMGLIFPITWVIWHLADRSYQTSPSRQSHATGASRSTS
jgi:hypothetical protein